MIADDDEPLTQRVDDLAEWCGSFLSGFAAANANGRDQLPVDIQEIIRDFATLSSMGSEVDFEDDEGESAQDEESFSEIYEFVRVSVLLVLALLDEKNPDAQPEIPGELFRPANGISLGEYQPQASADERRSQAPSP